jgi:archaetidylserine synthase
MNVLRELRPPDLFTLLNAILGFAAVLAACRGEVEGAFTLILLAAVADGLDGFLARRTGASKFGPDLDSMADLVSFGVAPSVLVAALLAAFWPVSPWTIGALCAVFCGIFLACGILRLARFNISPKNDLCFEGLPIPAAGIIASASVLLGRPVLTLILFLLLSALMVSSIPYPKIRDVKLAAPLAIVFLASAFLVWSGSSQDFAAFLFYAATAAYLLSPVVISCPKKER